MPNKCDVCGKEFYSDTEFENHQFLEKVEKLLAGNGEVMRWLASQILDMNVLTVQRRDRCDIKTATATWWRDQNEIHLKWNRQMREKPGNPDGPTK